MGFAADTNQKIFASGIPQSCFLPGIWLHAGEQHSPTLHYKEVSAFPKFREGYQPPAVKTPIRDRQKQLPSSFLFCAYLMSLGLPDDDECPHSEPGVGGQQ